MTRAFIHDDFLLTNVRARELFHCHGAGQPIIDFHNHLPASQIAANHQFQDLSELWLAGDHYKWRAMRANGVSERLITGDGAPQEKFFAWAATVPHTLRNPLYHWTHLELARDFGLHQLLDSDTAGTIWREANLQLPGLRVYDLLRRHHVRALCTSDDPADSLEAHHAIQRSGLNTRVYPTYRPDKALNIGDAGKFNAWLERLGQAASTSIHTLDDLLAALKKRHDDFHAIGCRLSDHGLESCHASPTTHAQASRTFSAVRAGGACTTGEHAVYASFLMLEFGRWDAARNWTKQLHLGALRNNNSRLLSTLGADTGFDSIGDFPQAQSLAAYLNALELTGELPRMIIYNLNPRDNYLVAGMIGNFQDSSVRGKIQMGSGWWFLDQKEGIEWQINALSNLGLLRRFVGMVTDSRSFLSFPRHEYFRRVLCNLLGRDMESGELPDEISLIGGMVREICFDNARDYFGLELGPGKESSTPSP